MPEGLRPRYAKDDRPEPGTWREVRGGSSEMQLWWCVSFTCGDLKIVPEIYSLEVLMGEHIILTAKLWLLRECVFNFMRSFWVIRKTSSTPHSQTCTAALALFPLSTAKLQNFWGGGPVHVWHHILPEIYGAFECRPSEAANQLGSVQECPLSHQWLGSSHGQSIRKIQEEHCPGYCATDVFER